MPQFSQPNQTTLVKNASAFGRASRSIAFILSVLAISLSLGYAVSAWTEPTLDPPGLSAGVAVPLNTGSIAQTKTGDLSATNFLDADNPTYFINPSGMSKLKGDIVTEGGIKVGDTGATLCDENSRGTMKFVFGDVGVADEPYYCVKTASGNYSWVAVNGYEFETVTIGTQTWMASNLNIGVQLQTGNNTPLDNGIIEKWCPAPSGTGGAVDNLQYSANCVTDGGLYKWDEAMNYSAIPYGTDGWVQDICPVGFHIPTDAEQYTLEKYLKDGANSCDNSRAGWDCDTAGTKLKVGGSSGFEGTFAGMHDVGGSFVGRGVELSLWSSSTSGASVQNRVLHSNYSTALRTARDKAYGYSVRCLSNATIIPVSPSQITVLVATAGNAQVVLNWTLPTDGGSVITGYNIYRSLTSGNGFSFIDTTDFTETANRSYTDTGLTNGTIYYYKVTAINAVGEGSLVGATESNTMADCNPADVNVYQTKIVAIDADHDGYTTSATSSQCVGDSVAANGRTYYKNSSGIYSFIASGILGTSDCNDVSVIITYATDGTCDGDNDGFIDFTANRNPSGDWRDLDLDDNNFDSSTGKSGTILYVTQVGHRGCFCPDNCLTSCDPAVPMDTFCQDSKPSQLQCNNIHAFIDKTSMNISQMPEKLGVYGGNRPVYWYSDPFLTKAANDWPDMCDGSIIRGIDRENMNGMTPYVWTGDSGNCTVEGGGSDINAMCYWWGAGTKSNTGIIGYVPLGGGVSGWLKSSDSGMNCFNDLNMCPSDSSDPCRLPGLYCACTP